MRKNEVLFTGNGECGGKVTDKIVTMSKKRFIPYFVNSSKKDIDTLKPNGNVNENNYFIIPAADGTGRNRELSKNLYAPQARNIIEDIIKKFENQKIIYFSFSMDGGSGGSSTISLMKGLKLSLARAGINKKVIGIAILPTWELKSKTGRRNAIACWNEIVDNTDAFDLMYVINNDSRDTKKGYDIINTEIAELFNMSYDICVGGDIGSIDSRDRAKMYNVEYTEVEENNPPKIAVMYKLNDEMKDAKLALESAKSSSIFATVDNFRCKNALVSLKIGSRLNSEAIGEELNYENEFIEGTNDKYTFVMATGIPIKCIMSDIETIEDSLNDEKKKQMERAKTLNTEKNIDLKLKFEDDIFNAPEVKKENKKSIDEILDNDDFFDNLF